MHRLSGATPWGSKLIINSSSKEHQNNTSKGRKSVNDVLSYDI